MKTSKLFVVIFVAAYCAITIGPLSAQNKNVNEECQNDIDCTSGKCLQRRDGKKVCGTCTQDRLNTLTDRVTSTCKDEEKMPPAISDQGDVSMQEIETKIEICKECITARKEVLNDCFYGNPDPDHVKQVEQWETTLANNLKIKDEKTSYRGAYYGAKSDYESYLRYINDKCSKDFQRAQEDAERRKQEKGGCADLENWIKSCEECTYYFDEFKKNAFKGQMSSKREETLEKYKSNLTALKSVLDHKKSNALCE